MPGDADADVSLPFVEGVAPLGPYSLEAQRRATRRTRTMTAVASVVLAGIVGAAAIYLASPLGQRDEGTPAIAVAPADTPAATDRTGAVSAISTQPGRAVIPPEQAEAADPVEAEPPQPAEPAADPVEAEAPALAEPAADPVEAEPLQPAERDEPRPDAVQPELADPRSVAPPARSAAPVAAPAAPAPAAEPTAGGGERAVEREVSAAPNDEPEAGPVGYDGSWVCNDQVIIEDGRVRDWSLRRVSFRPRNGFERVVLHLDRAGSGSGQPASVTAEAMGSWKVQEDIAGADRPGLGRRSVALDLDDGFSGSLALRGYRPAGLDIIKEFSVYPAGRDGRRVIISADTDGCFRVRVPAWNDTSASVRRAEIHVDIRP